MYVLHFGVMKLNT